MKNLYLKNLSKEDILNLLNKAGLNEELAEQSKEIFFLRNSIICKYINYMTREESCVYMYNARPDYGYISIKTYSRKLIKAELRLSKYL